LLTVPSHFRRPIGLSSHLPPAIRGGRFMLRLSILSLLLIAMAAIAPRFLCAQGGSDKAEATITLHLDQAKTKIAPEVYGQFAEHLGHCIYGGIWVGQES